MKWKAYVVIILSHLSVSLVFADVSYKVTGVANWDTLSMRDAAGISSEIVVKIPHDATGISATGKKEVVGSTYWIQVRYLGKTGWVSQKYLVAMSPPQSSSPAPAQATQATRSSASPTPPTSSNQSQAHSGWVTGVAKDDTLSLREAPGVSNALVAEIPPNSRVTLTGKQKWVGSTQWSEVHFNDKKGWVSKRYIREAKTTSTPVSTTSASTTPNTANPVTRSRPAPQTLRPSAQGIVTKKQSGMWILECGNASPYWKVEVLPEWLSIYTPKYETGVPIAYKRQRHGKWNQTAVRTEIGGKRGTLGLEMTLRYTAQCYSTLSQRKVTFSVKGELNGETISGCCRSYQVP